MPKSIVSEANTRVARLYRRTFSIPGGLSPCFWDTSAPQITERSVMGLPSASGMGVLSRSVMGVKRLIFINEPLS